MIYSVIIQPDAIKSLNKIPMPDRTRILRKASELAHNPRLPGMKVLRGPVELNRIRSGNYRVIYRIHDDILEVVVIRIGHRKDIYRNLGK